MAQRSSSYDQCFSHADALLLCVSDLQVVNDPRLWVVWASTLVRRIARALLRLFRFTH